MPTAGDQLALASLWTNVGAHNRARAVALLRTEPRKPESSDRGRGWCGRKILLLQEAPRKKAGEGHRNQEASRGFCK